MGRRSNFKRHVGDTYQTIDPRAVQILMPHLRPAVKAFAEPCAGQGYLVRELEREGLRCVWASDIGGGDIILGGDYPLFSGVDAMRLYNFQGADAIVTNPPWTRQILHELIAHFQAILPTWLLFDAAWMFNKHAAQHLAHCTDIVAVGRLRWIPNSPWVSKDDAAWYRFWQDHNRGPRFHGRVR